MKRLSATTYARLYQVSASDVPATKRAAVATAFIQLLRRHRALKLLPRIMHHLERFGDAAAKRTRVHVTTSQDPDRATLEHQLQKALGTVVLDVKVDPALRGGLVLRVDDTQVDGSLRTRLDQLHHHLTTV